MLHNHFMVFHLDGDYPRSQYELMCTRPKETLNAWNLGAFKAGSVARFSKNLWVSNALTVELLGLSELSGKKLTPPKLRIFPTKLAILGVEFAQELPVHRSPRPTFG